MEAKGGRDLSLLYEFYASGIIASVANSSRPKRTGMSVGSSHMTSGMHIITSTIDRIRIKAMYLTSHVFQPADCPGYPNPIQKYNSPYPAPSSLL